MSQGYIYPPPSDGKAFRLNMGLRTLEAPLWLEGGADRHLQILERIDLARSCRETVYQELAGYQGAIADLVTLIAQNLSLFHGSGYIVGASSITHKSSGYTADLDSPDVLLQLATVIAEDLVVLAREVAPENYWWRTERQTLTRSTEGEFLFFTIRNRAEPLAWIKSDSEAATLFAETLESFTPETIEYKGLQRDHQAIIDYLRN